MKYKVALTGHRPARLHNHEAEVAAWIRSQLENIDCKEAYSGMAQGADQIFAQIAEGMNIPLYCCYPYRKKKFHPAEEEIIAKSEDVYFINEDYSKRCYWERDKYMVDCCDILLAIWDGVKDGGTWLTVNYAQKCGKKIIYYPAEKLKENDGGVL